MTNGDKIRNMKDEELIEWLDKVSNQGRKGWSPIGCWMCCYFRTHHYPSDCGDCEWKDGIESWVKSDCKVEEII